MPLDTEYFFSVDKKDSLEIPKIKGSRFIALIFPVKSQEDLKRAMAEAKESFSDASHHCFAYRLDGDELVQYQSDDGEPSGTAGAPIMRQIESFDLRNVLVVVVRYFGGTKLGKAGLIKSYGFAAKELLTTIELTKKLILSFVRIRFPYSDTSTVNKVISKFEVDIVEQSFDQETCLSLAIPKKLKMQFIKALNNSLAGSLDWEDRTESDSNGSLSL